MSRQDYVLNDNFEPGNRQVTLALPIQVVTYHVIPIVFFQAMNYDKAKN